MPTLSIMQAGHNNDDGDNDNDYDDDDDDGDANLSADAVSIHSLKYRHLRFLAKV